MPRYKKYKFDFSIKQDIDALSRSDNWHGIAALLEDYLFIFLSFVVTFYVSWYFYPFAVVIIGARQRALATLLHEAVHGTLAKNKYLNFLLGSFFSGYLIFQQFTSYKNSHVRFHHGHFGDPLLDPDYQYQINEGLYDDIEPKKFFIKYVFMPFFLLKVPSYLNSLIKHRLFASKNNRLEMCIVFVYLTNLVIFAHIAWEKPGEIILLFWLIPYLTSFQILGWFIELSEHYPLMRCYDTDTYMARNRQSNCLEYFLTCIHNEHFHLDHHLDPTTPFWNLPKVHNIRLRDPNYAKANQAIGGIFIPSDNAPSIIASIMNCTRLKRNLE